MKPFSLNIRGHIAEFNRPAVMAIINVTPDSFYPGSRCDDRSLIESKVRQAIEEGADFIDVGAYSSRPGASDVSVEEELRRLEIGLKVVRSVSPEIPVSVDTFRSEVASRCVAEYGADIVNDISGGTLDGSMFEIVARLQVSYILMHMRGNPLTMQSMTDYPEGVTCGVIDELVEKVETLRLLGVNDIIIDPGFGFAKTLQQNYQLLRELERLNIFDLPILVGLSRKSMVTRLLDISADQALNATTVLNTLALAAGASILRVHDVKAARQAVDIYCAMINSMPC